MERVDLREKRVVFGRSYPVLWFIILMLGLTVGAHAKFLGGKGFYYGGLSYDFSYNNYGELVVSSYDLRPFPPLRIHTDSIKFDTISGAVGAVVYNDLLYCFFETQSHGLCYVAFDPQTRSWHPVQTLSSSVYGSGLCAAVCGEAIYVFGASGASGFCFRSLDGKSFANWPVRFQNGTPRTVLDAVTFYPPGDDPAGILLVYKDAQGNLKSCSHYPSTGATTPAADLPEFPPPDPFHTWPPVIMGNLVLGTSSCTDWGYHLSGAKDPCVEFYGLVDKGSSSRHHAARWEYNLKAGSWTLVEITGVLSYDCLALDVIPYFTVVDPTNSTMQQQHAVRWADAQGLEGYRTFKSDFMVPQHNDQEWGWRGLPTATATATGGSDEEKQLRSLWQLQGLVLGPPPFPINATGDPDVRYLSYVSYGRDLTHTVTTTSTFSDTLSIASEFKLKAIGQAKLDLSYARGWTGSHGTTTSKVVSTVYSFGPEEESPSHFGTHGWAIFSAPIFITQWYKLYAYDWNPQGQGTYLGQDIYATSVGDSVLQVQNFSLTNPSDGSMQNLFDGLQPYPNSTDLAGWKGMTDWNRCTDWGVIFGDHSNPPVGTLNLGVKSTVTYGESTTTFDSDGNSNSFSVKAGGGIALNGYSEMVTLGYDGQWGTTTDHATTNTQTVSSCLNVPIPPPENPDYVRSMIVQPYWLQATTNKAPWVPAGYPGNLPWCITWRVLQAKTNDGRVIGTLSSPESANGIVRHGGETDRDAYKIGGGRLAWVDQDGVETPLPMGADGFDPSKGASVSLNGFTFAADGAKGRWIRKGDTWKYRTHEGVRRDPFTLELDFGAGSWSFEGQPKRLDQAIRAADGAVSVAIDIHGEYRLSAWLEHEVKAKWSHREKKSAWQPYGVHEVEGAYDSRTGEGHTVLKGHIPKGEEEFGDLEIRLNGSPVKIQLLATEDFLEKLQRGGRVRFESEGASFEADLGSGKWSARIEGGRFMAEMAPRGGEIRIEILVGGHTTSDQTMVVSQHRTDLAYGIGGNGF